MHARGIAHARTPASSAPAELSFQERTTARATGKFLDRLSIGRRWWPEIAGIVRTRAEHEGHERTREYLVWVAAKLEGVADASARGRRTLGLLRAGVSKLDEKRGRRGVASA